MSSLAALRRPFRERHLAHDELISQCLAWADAFPGLVRLGALATSAEGRTVPLLTLGPEPDRRRPSVWVDGNMHANELAGSSVALAIAEDVLALHVDGAAPHGLPAHAVEVLRDVLFFVAPRLCPDGAEVVLASARYVRSNPRDRRPARAAPRWVTGDVDGDGLALSMRLADPAGDHVATGPDGRVMRPRDLDDPAPWYRILPEGHIEGFDGRHIPDPHYLSDNEVDLNRNFPQAWKGEPEQPGAGGFATSEPESRGVVEHAVAHPEIFAWLNLHCFGGVVIRPPGDKPDSKMPIDDLALFRQLEAWSEAHTRYPTVSGFEEFTYEPDKPIWGDIVSWAHDARGAFAWTVELWDLFAEIGLPRPKRFVELYDRWRAEDLERLVDWDRTHNAGRIFGAWRPFDHPQLGRVELGGVDPRIGLWNPPSDRLDGVCRGQSAVLLRVAAMAPRLVVDVTKSNLSHGATHLDVRVENRGYLPTYVLESARDKPFNEPLWAELITTDGARVRGATRVALGHLTGWGRGRFNPSQSFVMPMSRGSSHRAFASFVVEGRGSVVVRVGSARVGFHERRLEVGEVGEVGADA
ncbi:MAG: peptidase M14 [Deltaproteobacteria bacterium]|nr:peptidase M14 [Deltaproteobacteria bacterium]